MQGSGGFFRGILYFRGHPVWASVAGKLAGTWRGIMSDEYEMQVDNEVEKIKDEIALHKAEYQIAVYKAQVELYALLAEIEAERFKEKYLLQQ